MRILEVILLIISILSPILISIKQFKPERKIGLALLVIPLVLQLSVEGYRWQMIPIYFLIAILIFCQAKEFRFFKGSWFRKILTGFLLSILLTAGWFLSTVLPVFELPAPSGKHKVGSRYLYLNTDLDEDITKILNDKRKLAVKVWYPASVDVEATEKYLNKGEKMGLAAKYGLPASIFNYLNYIETNTYISPDVADGQFPILIFSHGYYSNATGYYALLEEIVSQGYIVLNINHTYESTGTLFPDGEIKLYDQAYDRANNNEQMAAMAWEATQNFMAATTTEDQYKAIKGLMSNYVAVDITHRWSGDIIAILDELPKWNTSSFLMNRMDIQKTGVFGHSQGGAAAGQALLNDNRIDAAINIDGVQWGSMIDTLLIKPFAHISSDWAPDHPDFNKHAYRNRSTTDFYQAKILETGHSNFMDIPLMINLKPLNEAGSIAANEATFITADIVTSFFNHYLLGKTFDLQRLKESYPALQINKQQQLNKTIE